MNPVLLILLFLPGTPPTTEKIDFRTLESCRAAADEIRTAIRPLVDRADLGATILCVDRFNRSAE